VNRAGTVYALGDQSLTFTIDAHERFMKLSYVFAVIVGISALITAYYWYRASTVQQKAVWDYDPTLKPKNMQEWSFALLNALDGQQYFSNRFNKIAAIWAAIAAMSTLRAALLP
jgi:hypothetical protein